MASMRTLTRQLEYLVLAAIAVIALVAVLALAVNGRDGSTPAPRAGAATSTAQVPTCADAGIPPASGRQGTCRTKSAVLTFVNQTTALEVGDVAAQVASATILRATSASGRARDRMRVTIGLTMRNTGPETFTPGEDGRAVYLTIGDTRVESDAAQRSEPQGFKLSEPLAPADTRAGELRFEIGGAVTRRREPDGRAQLGVRVAGDRVGVVNLQFPELQHS
jgi:hypothetical protein